MRKFQRVDQHVNLGKGVHCERRAAGRVNAQMRPRDRRSADTP